MRRQTCCWQAPATTSSAAGQATTCSTARPDRTGSPGGPGTDRFYFTKALGSTNIDRVTDFAHGHDKLVLENAVFPGLPVGPLAAAAFHAGTHAADAGDRIIYNHATGALFFDSDGTG